MPGQGSVGERVRTLRLSRHLSQAQLAGAELSDSYISLIESGKRTPTSAVVRLLAGRLSCTPEYIAEGVEPEERVHLRVLSRHAELALRDGDTEQALDWFTDVLDRSDEEDLTVRVRRGRAGALEALGRLEEAIVVLESLREEAEQDQGSSEWVPIIVALARCYHVAGDFGRTVALGERALDRLGDLGLVGSDEAAELGRTLIMAHLNRGDVDRACEIGDRLLAVPDPDETTSLTTYRQGSLRALDDGLGGDALYLAQRALEFRPQAGMSFARARLRVGYARALLPEGASPVTAGRAMELLQEAEPALGGVDAAECGIEMARSHVLLGDPGAAVTLVRRVLKGLAGSPDLVVESARARLMLARALVAQGEHEEALSVLRGTRDDLEELPSSRVAAHTWRELGDLFGAADDSAMMMAAYKRALEFAGLRPTPQHEDTTTAGMY